MPAPGILSAETIKVNAHPQIAAAQASLDAAKSMVKAEKAHAYRVLHRLRTRGGRIGDFQRPLHRYNTAHVGRKHQIKASGLEAEAALMDAEMARPRRAAEMDADRRQLDAFALR